MADRAGVRQPVDRLEGGEPTGQRNHDEDGDTGEVLCPAVAVGEPAARWAPGQREGDQQRERGRRVRDVVQGVAQQGHRP